MKTIICHNQEEFNEAIKKKNTLIVLQDTTERIIVSVEARENSSVEARGNSSVEARENSSVVAWGNSSVEAWENSSVEARGNSSVEAWGNSSVEAWGNSSVVAWGNSSVVAWGNSSVEAWGNSSVEARGNSSVSVSDNSHVLVIGEIKNREFKQYDNGSIKIYITPNYDKSVLDRFKKENEKQILYKSVNPKTDCDYYTGKIKYTIGEEVIAPDFDPNPNIECGNGLHLCFNAITTRRFNKGKILKCLVDPEDIVVYSKNIEKVRCRKVVPVAVVDMKGNLI